MPQVFSSGVFGSEFPVIHTRITSFTLCMCCVHFLSCILVFIWRSIDHCDHRDLTGSCAEGEKGAQGPPFPPISFVLPVYKALIPTLNIDFDCRALIARFEPSGKSQYHSNDYNSAMHQFAQQPGTTGFTAPQGVLVWFSCAWVRHRWHKSLAWWSAMLGWSDPMIPELPMLRFPSPASHTDSHIH